MCWWSPPLTPSPSPHSLPFLRHLQDIICGAPLTERYLPVLEWPGASAWEASSRTLWHDPVSGGVISGYSRVAANLRQVVIRGAGHMVPFDQPQRALQMLTNFIDGRDFL